MSRPRKNLIGRIFNKITVISDDLNNPKKVIAKCECGNFLNPERGKLHTIKSCGKGKCNPKHHSILGQKFGKLLVIDETFVGSGRHRKCKLTVRCECGKEFEGHKNLMIKGKATSCGSGMCRPGSINLTDLTFGNLTVIELDLRPERYNNRNSKKKWMYLEVSM